MIISPLTISWIIFFVLILNPDLNYVGSIWWGTIGSFLTINAYFAAKRLLQYRKIPVHYLIWNLSFLFIVGLSTTWSVHPSSSAEMMRLLFVIGLTMWVISFNIDNRKIFNSILWCFLIANLINVIYILPSINLSELINMRLGSYQLGEKWNSNVIGMAAALATFMGIFLLRDIRTRQSRLLVILSIAVLSVIVVVTGSKKALFLLLFLPSMYYYLNSQRRLSSLVLIGIGGMIIFYALLNHPLLYGMIGHRLESVLLYMNMGIAEDTSIYLRANMLEHGFELIQENPIFGYGINTFNTLYGNSTAFYTYSHNNYIEIAVGVGLFGTLIYYSYALFNYYKVKTKSDRYAILAKTLILGMLINDIGLVSYLSFYTQFILVIIFASTYLSREVEVIPRTQLIQQ